MRLRLGAVLWLVGALVIFLLATVIQVCAVSEIGCEPYTHNVLKCWNNGSIENTTYIHRGLKQLANLPERANWTKYDVLIEVEDRFGRRRMIDFLRFLDVKGWDSDNLTYWRVWAEKNFSFGNRRLRARYQISQLLNDDYVNITFAMRTNNAAQWLVWGGKVHFIRKMKDIDIDLDSDIDAISYMNASGFQGQLLNVTSDQVIHNISEFLRVGDLDSVSAIDWMWIDGSKRDAILKAKGAGENADVFWRREMQNPIQPAHTYKMTEWWIDAPRCTKSCGLGISYFDTRYFCNSTGVLQSGGTCTAFPNTRNIQLVYKISFNTFMGSGYCFYGVGCYVNTTDNTTPLWFEVPKYDTQDKELVCKEQDWNQCCQDSIDPIPFESASFTRRFNLTCRKAINYSSMCFFVHENDPCSNRMKLECPRDTAVPVVELLRPLNNTITDETTVVFNCSGSDLYPLVNVSLWANFSGVWELNQSISILFDNDVWVQEFNVSGLVNGSYVWNCLYCDNNGLCGMAKNNHTLIIFQEDLVLGVFEGIPQMIGERRGVFDLALFFGLVGIVLLLIFAIVIRKRKDEELEGVIR